MNTSIENRHYENSAGSAGSAASAAEDAHEAIILASASARRKEILEQLHIPFYAMVPPCTEEIPSSMTRGFGVKKAAEYLAVKKVMSAAQTLKNTAAKGGVPQNAQSTPDTDYKAVCGVYDARFILAADTLIVLKGKIYGKPKSEAEARSFLSAFSGKRHKVYTGIAVFNRETGTYLSCTSVSRVSFARLNEEEKESYMESDEWRDAAGAYKIQGTAQRFIKRIEGSYSSIMGLPIFEFYEILKKHGYTFGNSRP